MKTLGKYQIKERIGHGGMGAVYRAHDPIIGRDVAVKIIREQILNVPEVRTRFYREAKSAGRLSHENIMVIHDVGEQDGQPFIVMEYLPGTDLRQMLDDGVDLPLGDKLRIALQICAGLKYAHEHGVVHRDIKPENIRVLPGRRVKILDFGIARLGDETVTITRASIGTPKYMSPEQVRSESVDHRSDVFSFGVLLYELLSGLNPFSGSNVSSISYKIVHEDPDPIPVGEGRMAEDLRSIVMTCLAKDREERYQDFGAVIADLKRSMTHGTVSSEEPPATDEASSGTPWWYWGAAAVVVVAIAAGSIVFAGSRADETPTPAPTESAQDDQVSTTTNQEDIEASVEAPRERVTEAQQRADTLSPGNTDRERTGAAGDSDRPPSETTSDTRNREQAVDARTHMQSLEQGVASARESDQLSSLFRGADARRESAENAMADGDYQVARREFEAAADAYQSVSEQIRSLKDAEAEAMRNADSEKDAMLSAKGAVSDGQVQSEPYRRAQTSETDGRRAYDDARYEEAATLFSEAAQLYEDATEVEEPAIETMSIEEEATQAMASLAQRTETHFTNENAQGLEAISPAFSISEWTNFFGVAHDVNAQVETTDLEISGERATFSVAIRLSFLNNRDNRMNNTLRQRWVIERNQDTWRVIDVESIN